MKKVLLLILVSIVFLCTSCNNKVEEKDINLKDIYDDNEYVIQNKARKLFNNIIPNTIYLESKDLSGSSFSEYFEKIITTDFESVILVYTNKKTIVLAMQFENTDDAIKEFNSRRQDCFLYKNIVFFNCGLSYELIFSFKESNNFTISNENILTDSLNTELILPDQITQISRYSFYNNENIVSLSCNNSLDIVGKYAFSECSNLKNIKLNDGLLIIEEGAFYNTEFEYIIIPSSVYYIGPSAFNNGVIYCESAKEEVDWSQIFATEDATVYWKGEWEYVDNVPSPIICE